MRAWEQRACKVCGREFVPTTANNVYCSSECALVARRRIALEARCRRKRASVARKGVDTFKGGMDPDESAMRAVSSLDDVKRRQLRLLMAPRVRDAVRMWMEDGQ